MCLRVAAHRKAHNAESTGDTPSAPSHGAGAALTCRCHLVRAYAYCRSVQGCKTCSDALPVRIVLGRYSPWTQGLYCGVGVPTKHLSRWGNSGRIRRSPLTIHKQWLNALNCHSSVLCRAQAMCPTQYALTMNPQPKKPGQSAKHTLLKGNQDARASREAVPANGQPQCLTNRL